MKFDKIYAVSSTGELGEVGEIRLILENIK